MRAGSFCETMLVPGPHPVPKGVEMFMGPSDHPPQLRSMDKAPKALLNASKPLGLVTSAARFPSSEGDAWVVIIGNGEFCVVSAYTGPHGGTVIYNANSLMMADKSWARVPSADAPWNNPPQKGATSTFRKRDTVGTLEAVLLAAFPEPVSITDTFAFAIVYHHPQAAAGATK